MSLLRTLVSQAFQEQLPIWTSILPRSEQNKKFSETRIYFIQRAVRYSKSDTLIFSGAKMSFLAGNDGDGPVAGLFFFSFTEVSFQGKITNR